MRLPKLEIPRFWVDATKWSIIKSNLLDVEKLKYLKSVIGEATNAIYELPLTNDNYWEAINILKDRFGNKQINILSHMNSFFETTYGIGE